MPNQLSDLYSQNFTEVFAQVNVPVYYNTRCIDTLKIVSIPSIIILYVAIW